MDTDGRLPPNDWNPEDIETATKFRDKSATSPCNINKVIKELIERICTLEEEVNNLKKVN